MSKLYLFYFILVSSLPALVGFQFQISPAFALDSVIIDRSDYGAPPPQSSGDDINFHPNDIFNTPTTDCPGSVTISQTFEPIQIGTSNGQPVYLEQKIDSIQQMIDFDRIYNKDPEKQFVQQGFRTKWTDDENRDKAFRSFDINAPIGASNMANRATPYAVLKCQKAQRLVKAVESLYPGNNGVITNEHLAWNCGGAISTILEKKDGTGCTPVRLADIAHALRSEKIFYNPNDDCYSYPDPITLPKAVPDPNPLSADSAALLLKNNVEAIDNGSLTRGVTTCNANNSSDCQYKEHQVPYGAHQASYQQTVSQIIPKAQELRKVDFCQTAKKSISQNKPNPLSFFAIIHEAFGVVKEKAQTFFGTVTVTYKIDQRANLDKNKTFLLDLLPQQVITEYQAADQPGSSTSGRDYSPGDPIPIGVFAKHILPMNF